MNTYKTKLLQNIEAMKEKLASMEEELNTLEKIKHFPSEGEIYYYYTSSGSIRHDKAFNDDILVNAYKSYGEAEEAYNKACLLLCSVIVSRLMQKHLSTSSFSCFFFSATAIFYTVNRLLLFLSHFSYSSFSTASHFFYSLTRQKHSMVL